MRDLFINTLLAPEVRRDGMEKLIDYLTNETDFFVAPASTRFHGAEPGGLLAHSVVVVQWAIRLGTLDSGAISSSVQITALLHDVCKANFYKPVLRWRKDEHNRWEQYPTWEIDDQLPLGHGVKSAWIVSKYIDLSDEEYAAIRWHMGAWGTEDYSGRQALNAAMDKYPLVLLLQTADMAATYLDKK